LPGRVHEYGFDPIGNRLWSNRTGSSSLRDEYTTNAANQYTAKENNTLPVSGTASSSANVVVNGSAALASRVGTYWGDEITVDNGPVSGYSDGRPWQGTVTVYSAVSGVVKTVTRTGMVAAALQDFSYDYDGNLTSDGVWDYSYDAENRLVRMETTSMAQSGGVSHRILAFTYDYLGRRVQKQVWNGDTSAELSCRRYLYDGWNLVAEYSASGGSSCGDLLRSYTWGLDLTGSLTKAGGIGALVQIAEHSSGTTYLPAYDGNGNVATLLNGSSGAAVATYEYSPFGEFLRCEGDYAADNPFRFSTKFFDSETGLVYFGHRFYSPGLGRFVNRDPIEEQGGLNLYGFCLNDAINGWDLLGNEETKTEGSVVQNAPFIVTAKSVPSAQRVTDIEEDILYSATLTNPNGLGFCSQANNGWFQSTYSAPWAYVQAALQGKFRDFKVGKQNHPATAASAKDVNQPKNENGHEALAPNSASGSALGNALRHIPLLGGLLGGVGDVVAGVGNTALGVVTLGASGTFGRGLGQIGYGVSQTADILARDIAATVVGVAGTAYLTARDVANVATFGQINALGNRSSPDVARVKTGVIGAFTRTVGDALIPEYGTFGGLHWGIETAGRNPSLIINQGDLASYRHDDTMNETRWVRDQYSTRPAAQWVGPVGAAYALIGTVPFGLKGIWDGEH